MQKRNIWLITDLFSWIPILGSKIFLVGFLFVLVVIKVWSRFFKKNLSVLWLYIFIINLTNIIIFNINITSCVWLILFIRIRGFTFSYIFKNLRCQRLYTLPSLFVPRGAPIALVIGLLFILEILRALIRPVALIIRLLANIRMGHILARLAFLLSINFIALPYEIFVCGIQRFVFCKLLTIYITSWYYYILKCGFKIKLSLVSKIR